MRTGRHELPDERDQAPKPRYHNATRWTNWSGLSTRCVTPHQVATPQPRGSSCGTQFFCITPIQKPQACAESQTAHHQGDPPPTATLPRQSRGSTEGSAPSNSDEQERRLEVEPSVASI